MSTLLLSFGGTRHPGEWLPRLGVLTAGVLLLYGITRIRWVDGGIHRLIGWGLKKWTKVEARDYEQLLMFEQDYGISELAVTEQDWLTGKTLGELGLDREGLTVLGIHHRAGEYVGAPAPCTRIENGDRLVVYGRSKQLQELDCRGPGAEGDSRHEQACSLRTEDVREQEQRASGA
ncbi:MAG: potassium transporter TrkA [bacterium]|nr:potassium transporter TrkA [bacterium]